MAPNSIDSKSNDPNINQFYVGRAKAKRISKANRGPGFSKPKEVTNAS